VVAAATTLHKHWVFARRVSVSAAPQHNLNPL
jgi:hypothetical protein